MLLRWQQGLTDLLAAADPGSDHQLALAKAYPAAAQDEAAAARLEGWLAGVDVPDGLGIDPELRWSIVRHLARLGRLKDADIDTERDSDRTITGAEQAAAAKAARPTAEAKREAWRLAAETDSVPNGTQRAVCLAFWQPDQDDVLDPYVERYLDVAEAISANRDGWASRGISLRTNVLRFLFPVPRDVAPFLDQLDAWRAQTEAGRIGPPADRGGSGQRAPRPALPDQRLGGGIPVERPLRVGDVADILDALYPPALAESWDVVGLAVGSRTQPVTRIALRRRLHRGGDRRGPGGACRSVDHPPPALPPGADLGRPGVTRRQDSSPTRCRPGSASSSPTPTPTCLGQASSMPWPTWSVCEQRQPLRPRPGPAVDKIITFVPDDHVEAVVDALAAAGAGRIGNYERCAFTSAGQGTFRPAEGAEPFLGRIGESEHVTETRVEMVLDRSRRREVRDALLAAHPYDEPAYDLLELAALSSAEVGLGRVGGLDRPTTLGDLADRLASALPRTPRGLNVAGDLQRMVARVAVQAGAGDDLLEEARFAGADVYITSDLRHHPASEALAWPDALALIDVSHWAAEWTWLPVVQHQVDDALEERRVPSAVSRLCTDPWTAHR